MVFPITEPAGVLTVLIGICALFFWLEQVTSWKLFQFIPPLMFIYALPLVLANVTIPGTGGPLLPSSSPVYGQLRDLVLPMMLVLLLINVDIGAALRIMGRGVFVMLAGTLGVVIGAPISYLVVRNWMEPDAAKAFGTLAGSWIGGTGNMTAAKQMINADDAHLGLAVLADTTVYIVWLPILLGSKALAPWFARFTGADADRVAKMEAAASQALQAPEPPRFQDVLYLLFLAVGVTWCSSSLADQLPVVRMNDDTGTVLVSASTWNILLITTIGIGLSFSPLRKLPGSQSLAMALVYIYVARVGASTSLEGVAANAIPFLVAAFIWIFIHGAFCLLAAKLLRVDVHTAAIASAANVGGAASAPVVAAHHNKSLVPASILMALIGYAVGNYAAYLAYLLCYFVSPMES